MDSLEGRRAVVDGCLPSTEDGNDSICILLEVCPAERARAAPSV